MHAYSGDVWQGGKMGQVRQNRGIYGNCHLILLNKLAVNGKYDPPAQRTKRFPGQWFDWLLLRLMHDT